MKQKDDYLWKGVLEDVFDDFLRFLYPDADSVFDLSRGITFLDKELEQLFPPEGNEFAPKVVDKLAQVYTHDGMEEWVLIHVEVQGTCRKDFASRMFTYYYRILDKYHKRITAFAILTEASKKPRPNVYEEEFMGTSIQYRFNTYKIAEQDTDRLLASDNPFALVVLTAKAAFVGKNLNDKDESDKALLQTKIQLARELLERNMSKEKIRGLMNFLRYYVRFDNSEVNTIFEQEVEKLTERSHTMGIEELLLNRAKKEGKRESLISVAREMKKDGIPVEQIVKFTKLSIKEIEKL
ncbi:hypothetical protein HMPREF0765_3429 [Sphingobacterium spiritivorum ATCC 33300]|uniref:Transposase (putative) YhgA-like domain-containing protein n=2 Tax=Sphingobacterium TaxID=28453 RepID=C2G1H3_SPHSI|nr:MULTISPECIES: hypothetical protein [Sphingobacterium]EEI90882.1 hypothetical protein HMPREF0765_3429 [Sphingobacterium spiritivorum ATCC 33300]MDM1048985.1 hypothetical protein [Sphingobacterium hotanense]QQS97770.1 hypothetical protein I6J03_08700 [Sphingobacterium spiritivorum]